MAGLAVLAALAVPLALASEPARGGADEPRRVVILNASDPYLPAFLALDSAVRGAIRDGSRVAAELFAETLDMHRFPRARLDRDVVALLRAKYRGLRVDVVVAAGSIALEFARSHRAEIWPDATIVFHSVPTATLRDLSLDPCTIGVPVELELGQTLDLSMRLWPTTRQIVVIAGTGEPDTRHLELARAALGRSAGLARIASGRTLAALIGSRGAAAADTPDAAAQANNPLANRTALNFHDYYIGRITDTDEDGNQFWVRFAKPFEVAGGNWLMRASLPVNTFPVAADGGLATGIGDLNVFAAYLFDTGNPAVSFGFGPQITAPTAPDERLGSEKCSAGFANVLFDDRSKRFQYGYLLTWQGSFAGSDDRADVNAGAFQPFLFYQLGKGTYLRSAPIWVYNFENDAYSVPLGLGVGQVIKRGKTVFNVFVEPQASVAYRGPGQPDWQIFAGFNMQFLQ